MMQGRASRLFPLAFLQYTRIKMTVLLNRNYGAYAAGMTVSLPASTEAAIIAQNIGQATGNLPTAGNINSNEHTGVAAIAAGASSVTITNPNVNPGIKVAAYISLATADGTLTALRVVPGNGSFTVYGNANATGAVPINWQLLSTGLTPNQ